MSPAGPLGSGFVENSNDIDQAATDSGEPASIDLYLGGGEAALLPTMEDLDRLSADLDRVDATLAALDRDGISPVAESPGPQPVV